jgi:hypothetical protein
LQQAISVSLQQLLTAAENHLSSLSQEQLINLAILAGFLAGGMFGTNMRVKTETFIYDQAFNQGYKHGYSNGFKQGVDAYYIPRQHSLLQTD